MKKRLFGIILSFALMLTVVPVLSQTAYAATDFSDLVVKNSDTADTLSNKVVTFNGESWYIIKDDSAQIKPTVTLLRVGSTANWTFDYSSNEYKNSEVKEFLDEKTGPNGDYASVAPAIAGTDFGDVGVTGARLYLLSKLEAEALPEAARKLETGQEWWLRTKGDSADNKAYNVTDNGVVSEKEVDYSSGVRPALRLDLTQIVFDTETRIFDVAYPLWVSGVQVTSANMRNVLKGDPDNNGKVSYDPYTNTLTLKGANIKTNPQISEHDDYAIYYEGKEKDLTIDATEASTVTATGGDDNHGIYALFGNLVFNGTLSVISDRDGIDCPGNLTVNGKLSVTGKEIGIFIDSGELTVNSGAELSTSGNKLSGIGVNDDRNGFVNIKEGAKVTAVGGEDGAIEGIVKNSISGTAWTDKNGTAGETAIEVNTDGKKLDAKFKKAQFPAKEPVVTQYTISYDLNGGTLDGQTGIVTKKIDACTVITLPAPTRDGYTFDYWEGSKYKAGDKYTVTADHTFKAVWKAADKGGGSDSGDKGGSSKKGVNTGDENALGAWIVLMLAALAGTTGMVFARKRKGE